MWYKSFGRPVKWIIFSPAIVIDSLRESERDVHPATLVSTVRISAGVCCFVQREIYLSDLQYEGKYFFLR